MTWRELTRLTRGAAFEVERVRLGDSGIAIEGKFEPPPLARLSEDDQVFVMAFVQSHGSIKRMEELFGVSYPTVKNRLNRISALLPLVDVGDVTADSDEASATSQVAGVGAVLDRLERGEMSAAEAAAALRRFHGRT